MTDVAEEGAIAASPKPTATVVKLDELAESDNEDDVSSNADSDFIDVPDIDSDISMTLRPDRSFETNIAPFPSPSKDFRHSDLLMASQNNVLMEVIVKPDADQDPQDDLFADVFSVVPKTTTHSSFDHLKTAAAATKVPSNLQTNVSDGNIATSTSSLQSTPPIVTKMASAAILNELNMQMNNIEKITLKSLVAVPTIASPAHKLELPAISNNILPSTSKRDLSEILNNLNKEIIDFTEAKLDTASLLSSISQQQTACTERVEVIEIDSDDNDPAVDKPKTKQSSISSFVQVTVTPSKAKLQHDANNQELQETPKVASPFFRKKTPSSKQKSSESTPVKPSKVAKSLFGGKPVDGVDNVDSLSQSIELNAPLPLATAEDTLQTAASVLRSLKSADELANLAAESRQETRDLQQERNKQDRLGMSITERMNDDCKRLLRLFGIPYVVAPMEAEAQCAFYDSVNLTDGTITDDSDIWLFGGQTVYKNFFDQQKNVMEFRAEQVERAYNVERKKLIQIAMLVGSDYTTGKYYLEFAIGCVWTDFVYF